MKTRVIMTGFLAAVAAIGQTRPESAPETRNGIEALKPLMARLRAGEPDFESARVIVSGLLESEHAMAAPWWLALIAEAQSDVRLLPEERDTLAKLRRAAERPDSFPEERKLILRVIRVAESLAAAKDFDGTRQAASTVAAFLGLIPDPTLRKLLEPVEKKVAEHKAPGQEPGKRTPWPSGLEADAGAAFRKLIQRGLAAYAEAGCRPGRFALARSIRDASALLSETEVAATLARLRALTKIVEPKSGLVVVVRTIGQATFLRDGAPIAVVGTAGTVDAEKHEPVDIAVVPGDLLTIAFAEPYASDEISRSYVIAFNGRFESRDLGPKDLFCDLSESPGGRDAVLLPVPIAKKKTNPPRTLFGRGKEQDEALRAFNTYFELPKTNRRSVDVPCLGDMIMFLQEFETRRLAPILIGTETDHFALVIKVPE